MYTRFAEEKCQHKDQAPVLLLHGFDSSSLEFRRLLPLLEQKLETWAVDLVGWGFSDSGAATHSDMKLGPKQKRDHMYAFWKEKVNYSHSLVISQHTANVAAYPITVVCCSSKANMLMPSVASLCNLALTSSLAKHSSLMSHQGN